MPVSGAVDAVLGRFVVGWVHDPEDADRRVEVELEIDGELVGTATADLERGDLLVAQIGDGCHAFRIELPRGFEPGSEHMLAVRTDSERLTLPLANDFVVEFEPGQSGPEVVVSVPPDPPWEDPVQVQDAPAGDAEPLPALLGAHDWLYELYDPEVMRHMLGRRRLPADQIARHRAELVERHRRLQELGVVYVVAVLPAKLTLYSDHLTPELEPTLDERAAHLVVASLRDDNRLELLDLLPALRDARSHAELMPSAGAGLTWTGAFHAYRALAKELAKRWPVIEPLPLAALKPGVQVPLADSLAARERFALVRGRLVAIAVGLEPAQTEPELVSGGLGASFVPLTRSLEERLGPGASMLEVSDAQVSESAIVVHGGGGARVASFLAEHFARTLVAGNGEVPYEAAQSEDAVVVVELIDELNLCE